MQVLLTSNKFENAEVVGDSGWRWSQPGKLRSIHRLNQCDLAKLLLVCRFHLNIRNVILFQQAICIAKENACCNHMTGPRCEIIWPRGSLLTKRWRQFSRMSSASPMAIQAGEDICGYLGEPRAKVEELGEAIVGGPIGNHDEKSGNQGDVSNHNASYV